MNISLSDVRNVYPEAIDKSRLKKYDITDYKQTEIPKRSGGTRLIEEPNEKLKKKQEELLDKYRNKDYLYPSWFAHAFLQKRNIVTAAKPHVGRNYVYRTDVKDFFGSINIQNTLVHTEIDPRDTDQVMDLALCFKFNEDNPSENHLPQGAPTSPFISNAYMRNLDWRLARFCAKPAVSEVKDSENAVYYTRYADDLFFSSDNKFWLNKVIDWIPKLLTYYNLEENKEKQKMMENGERKEVCGIVVNEKLNLPREKRKAIRAALHNAKFDSRGYDEERHGLKSLRNMVNNQEEFPDNNVEVVQSLSAMEDISDLNL